MSSLSLGLAPFALGPSASAATLEPLVEQCQRAERLGYESVWIPESHFTGGGATPAPLLLLSAVAARTSRLALGTTSYLLPIRHPLHVAAEVAVLDRLSGGRVILGVGRGFRPALFDAFEVPRAEKRDRFEAALETMRRAWRGEAVVTGHDGEPPVTLAPLPLQQPHPPIWVAAFGPKALAQAGRLGLPYLASPMEPLARLAQNYERHREACPASVPYGELPVPVMRTVFVTRSADAERRVVTALMRQATALRQSGGRWLREVGGAEVEEFALVGEPGAIAEGIARYREAVGLTHLIARVSVPGAEPDEIEGSVELLAELCQGNVV